MPNALSPGPASFALLAQRKPRCPAQQTLQRVIGHELGHFFGLIFGLNFGLIALSRHCADVMICCDNSRGETGRTRDGSAYQTVAEYRALLPTACDIERCRAVKPWR